MADDLLTILTSYSGGYKLMRKRMFYGFDFHADNKNAANQKNQDHSIRITLSRLKKQGLVNNENKIWQITQKGVEFLNKRLAIKMPHFRSDNAKNKKNLIIIFDVPEKKRKERDWLRMELKSLGFSLVQRSVWMGPTPLPKDFVNYISKTKLISHIRFFKATEEDLV